MYKHYYGGAVIAKLQKYSNVLLIELTSCFLFLALHRQFEEFYSENQIIPTYCIPFKIWGQ